MFLYSEHDICNNYWIKSWGCCLNHHNYDFTTAISSWSHEFVIGQRKIIIRYYYHPLFLFLGCVWLVCMERNWISRTILHRNMYDRNKTHKGGGCCIHMEWTRKLIFYLLNVWSLILHKSLFLALQTGEGKVFLQPSIELSIPLNDNGKIILRNFLDLCFELYIFCSYYRRLNSIILYQS